MQHLSRLTITFLLSLSFTLTACAESPEPKGAQPTNSPTIKIKMFTNKGPITLELNQAKAPNTVKNFLRYANQGFYDGTIFHRVIPGFMIQGGGFGVGMNKKETHPPIINEANNGLKNYTGTIAMARTGDPHSATAQFFINVSNNTSLDHTSKTSRGWGYTVFGKVTEGMDVVKTIENSPTTSYKIYSDVPSSDIIIEKVKVIQ